MRPSIRTAMMCATLIAAAGTADAFGYGGFSRARQSGRERSGSFSDFTEHDLEALRKAKAKRERKQAKRISKSKLPLGATK